MSNTFDYYAEPLVDPQNRGFTMAMTAQKSDTQLRRGEVASYDPATNTCEVWTYDTGGRSERPIRVGIETDLLGKIPGTGRATAFWRFQPVILQAVGGGSGSVLVNQFNIVGAQFGRADHHAPADTAFQQNAEEQGGTVETYGTADGRVGNSTYKSANSDVSDISVGRTNREDWGNEHTIANGTNMTRAEELTRESAKGMRAAAARLSGKKLGLTY